MAMVRAGTARRAARDGTGRDGDRLRAGDCPRTGDRAKRAARSRVLSPGEGSGIGIGWTSGRDGRTAGDRETLRKEGIGWTSGRDGRTAGDRETLRKEADCVRPGADGGTGFS